MSENLIVKIINNQSSVIWPSVKSGPYTVELYVDCVGIYKIILCAYCSKSYTYEYVKKHYNKSKHHLIPHHRFLNENNDIIEYLIINPEDFSAVNIDGKTMLKATSTFYYIDDMPTAPYPLYLQAEVTTIQVDCEEE